MAGEDNKPKKKKAPTLYGIAIVKLVKGLFFMGLALAVFHIADRDLPKVLRDVLIALKLNPEHRFWTRLADKVGNLTAARVRWTAAGTFVYSLFSLVEGTGLLFRAPWAGWLTIGETAFFIPIEMFELERRFTYHLAVILGLNITIVWYLYQNRVRLFKH
jgi:uncharacterized membrane protein (DUF2068 family)